MNRMTVLAIAAIVVFALLVASSVPAQSPEFELESTIAFVSTRDNPTGVMQPLLRATEIYLASPDLSPDCLASPECPKLTNLRRLTNDLPDDLNADLFAALSPDGKKIVFESNRLRADGEPLNTSDLFVMNTDGTEQTLLTRGSSATWSPDSKNIAFHASASGTGQPINLLPGAPATDSDIFVVNVDDLLKGVAEPKNLTDNGSLWIDEDADWSPVLLEDGQFVERIVFTRKNPDCTDNAQHCTSAEIWVINPDGTALTRLTFNTVEERAPAWSPDGTRILFMCRIGDPATSTGPPTFEICVMNADGTGPVDRLTDNAVGDLTPTWSPDGEKIMFHRPVAVGQGGVQLWLINAVLNPDGTVPVPVKLTDPPGQNAFANWGELSVRHRP